MTDRNTYDGRIALCKAHGYYPAKHPCPRCFPRQLAGNGQKTAIDGGGPLSDTGKGHEQAAQGTEPALQRDVEAWLRFVGYWPRDKKHIEAGVPPRGWYFHVREAKGNPIMLDLLVVDFNGPWVEIELKTAVGRESSVQVAIRTANGKHSTVCRSLESAKEWLRKVLDIQEA